MVHWLVAKRRATIWGPCIVALCAPLVIGAPARGQTSCGGSDVCTSAGVCRNGECTGTPIQCPDDGDPCTVEHCNPGIGCVSTPLDCDDGNPCTADSCTTGVGCAHAPVTNGMSCDTNAADCVSETCQNGICTPAPLNATGCDDDNDCTIADVCQSGVCIGGADLPDGTTCGGAAPTDPCRPECISGTCEPGENNGTMCDDGRPCTVNDVCSFGICSGTSTCPSDPCAVTFCSTMGCGAIDKCPASLQDCFQTGACNPSTGQCFNTPVNEGGACDDGNSCTANDHCVAGECSGQALGVVTLAPTLAPRWLAVLAVALTIFAVWRAGLRRGRP